MSTTGAHTHKFFAKRVAQREFTLYLSSIKACELGRLCEGLRAPESRELPLESDAAGVANDASGFVDALTASPAFADEVSRIEASSYSQDNPYQRLIDESRVRSIAAYLREESALMPNGVVLAVDENAEC